MADRQWRVSGTKEDSLNSSPLRIGFRHRLTVPRDRLAYTSVNTVTDKREGSSVQFGGPQDSTVHACMCRGRQRARSLPMPSTPAVPLLWPRPFTDEKARGRPPRNAGPLRVSEQRWIVMTLAATQYSSQESVMQLILPFLNHALSNYLAPGTLTPRLAVRGTR